MKVLCVVEHGDAPSTRLRLRDCLGHYQKLDVNVTVLSTRSTLSDRWRVIRHASRHDVVVLFKTVGFTKWQLALLQRANPRIIFDFDDAVMFREQKFQQPLSGKSFQKFLRTMNRCAAAVAGNDFLASFASANIQRVVVLPTAIDLTKYSPKKPGNALGLTIGWMGLSDGLPYLQFIQPALQQLSERCPGLKLRVISDRPLRLDGVVVENETWRAETEQANLASFDIGIMPIWDSLWTRGKCGYKILQYMGVGTAVVASAVGANNQIVNHGENGFLATTQDDWVRSISALVENAELRKNFGLRGRELVERSYSLDAFANGYVKLMREVAAD